MIYIKTEAEIQKLREGGRRHGAILAKAAAAVKPGMSTKDLDTLIHTLITEGGDIPAFLGYRPEWAAKPFPGSSCISLNNEIVHGIPSAARIIKAGDLVKIDIGLNHAGVFTDAAVTVIAGKSGDAARDTSAERLIKLTRQALYSGIDAAKSGARLGDVGAAIESVWKKSGFVIPDGLCGHGVGRYIHEDPYVLNEGRKGTGEVLKPGMVIAIEPMLNEGGRAMKVQRNDHVCVTADGKLSAHFEHTVLITAEGPEILTELP